MKRSTRMLASLPFLGAAVFGVAACGTDSGSPAPTVPSASDQVAATVLIDVRTPGEYAGGHLDGAINIPVESPDFVSAVAAAVPSGATVEVYCRSGNRSSQADAMLSAAGINVVDLGSYADAAATTGLPTV